MDFAARPARSRITHLPEIVVLVSEQNPVLGKMLFPFFQCFRVHFGPVRRIAFEHGGIKSVLVYSVHPGQKLPCPRYRLRLEIVAEAPVSEHLEHRMMVGIVSHFLEIVVFSAHSQAFLAVRHSFALRHAVSEKIVLELIHPGVCEHQCRVVFYNHRSRRYDGMSFRCEKIQKGFSYFL